MKQPLDRNQIEQAIRHMDSGMEGGFAAKLADAWFVADSSNRRLIEVAFENLIRKSYTHSTCSWSSTI